MTKERLIKEYEDNLRKLDSNGKNEYLQGYSDCLYKCLVDLEKLKFMRKISKEEVKKIVNKIYEENNQRQAGHLTYGLIENILFTELNKSEV